MSTNTLTFPELDSTNTYAKDHLVELSHGTIIVADIQTAGRGRQGHLWQSDTIGNVYASLVIKPSHATPKDLPVLTQRLAQAIIATLKDYGVTADMKWPNDVMVGGKKIAGILAESVSQGMKVIGVVMGFGVNLAMTKKAVEAIVPPATSLNLLMGNVVNRDEVLDKVIAQFLQGSEP